MSDISVFDIRVFWSSEPEIHSGEAAFRFWGTTADRDRIIGAVEAAGMSVAGFQRFDAMSADDAIKHVNTKLSMLAFATQRSPLRGAPISEPDKP